MLDLTGVSKFTHTYEIDEINGTTTVTFKDEADVVRGSIKLETTRFRKFFEVLNEVNKERRSDLVTNTKPITKYSKLTDIATSYYGAIL